MSCFLPGSFLHRARLLALGWVLWMGGVEVAAADGKAGREYFFEAWQTEDGLPEQAIRDLAQTGDGYLWMATIRGLVRFDGVQFRLMTPRELPGLASPALVRLLVGTDGALWISTPFTLGHLQGGQMRAYTRRDGYLEEAAAAMTQDRSGQLWLGSWGDNLVRYDGQFHTVPRLGAPRSTPDLVTTADGTVLLGCRDLLAEVQAGNLIPIVQQANGDVRVALRREGGVWFTANGWLQQFSQAGGVRRVAELPRDLAIRRMLEDRHGNVWLGTKSQGLLYFAEGRFRPVANSHSSILSLLEDREGSLWVGTEGGGLNRVRERVFEVLDRSRGLPGEVVTSVAEDRDGAMWCVTGDGAVSCWRYGQWQHTPPALNQVNATCIAATPDGRIWMGTDERGLFVYDRGVLRAVGADEGLKAPHISVLHVTREGALVAGTSAEIYRKQGERFTMIDAPDLKSAGLRCLADEDGVLWAGGGDGTLHRFGASGHDVFGRQQGLSGEPLRCLLPLGGGEIWIGTHGGGLCRWKDGRGACITKEQGLWDDSISMLQLDADGFFWCGSPRGLFRVRKADLEEFFAGRRVRVESEAFGRADGLPSFRCAAERHPRSFVAQDGRLHFATHRGVVIVDPQRINAPPPPFPPKLDDVKADGHLLRSGVGAALGAEHLAIPPAPRSIEFAFSAPCFTAPEKQQFRHRLLGLTDEWSEPSPARNATFHVLAPGAYVFEVASRVGDGPWSGQVARLAFTIEPSLTQTPWFRGLASLVGAGTAFFTIRHLSQRRVRMRLRLAEAQTALERERTRLARDMHDDVGADLTHIALLGDLAREDHPEPAKVQAHVEKIVQTSQKAIRSLDEIVWAVNPRNDTLAHLIEYAIEHGAEFLSTAKLDFDVLVPHEIPPWSISAESRYHMLLAIKEALHNAVQHASATRVEFRVQIDQDLRIAIADNGHGFESLERSGPGADGLRNMRERLRHAGGECLIESAHGRGTCVTLILPRPTTC